MFSYNKNKWIRDQTNEQDKTGANHLACTRLLLVDPTISIGWWKSLAGRQTINLILPYIGVWTALHTQCFPSVCEKNSQATRAGVEPTTSCYSCWARFHETRLYLRCVAGFAMHRSPKSRRRCDVFHDSFHQTHCKGDAFKSGLNSLLIKKNSLNEDDLCTRLTVSCFAWPSHKTVV